MYSLDVRGSSVRIKNFAILHVDVPMADKIALKDGRPSVIILWTLAKPYIIPDVKLKNLNPFIAQWRFLFRREK